MVEPIARPVGTMMDASATDSTGTGLGLRHYLDVIRRRKLIVLLVLAIAVVAAVVVTQLQTPKYRATTKIVIGQGQGLFSPTLANAFQPFSATMSDLLESNVVARKVIANLALDESEESLLAKISITIKPESSALTVSVEDHNRFRARAIAGNIGIEFARLVRERFGKATPVGAGQPPLPPLTATVWDPAHIDPERVSPRPKRDIAIAGALGLILGLLAGFLRDHFDRGLRTREAIEQSFGVPVIGQIPNERRSRRPQPYSERLFGESAEAYRALRANLQYLAVERPLRTILITSPAPQQGKTTVTANLAAAIARSGASTIALEADLRRPRLAEFFGLDGKEPGLTSVLVGTTDLAEATQKIPLFPGVYDSDEASVGQLAFLPSGPLPPNPSELLSSRQMSSTLEELMQAYDHVLIDSPPLLLVADALELTRVVDGVVMVVRQNRTTKDEAREIRSLVERLDIHLLGTVVTGVEAVGQYYGTYAPTREPRRIDARRSESELSKRS
jgi:capsular exopolysaccharide synthesis family protein